MCNTSRSLVATGIIVVLLALLPACSTERQDWQSAQTADTLESYDSFLSKHPDSEFAVRARERSKQLTEERDWRLATEADTAEAYRNFISQHPEGKWTQEARVRFENFNIADGSPATVAGPSAVAAPAASTQAAPAPAADPKPRPTSVPAAVATPAAPTPASHRIQLGAFSSEAKAKSEWDRLRAQFADLNGLVARFETVESNGARLWRLQASVASEQRARDLCAALKARSQPCLYVEK